MKPITQKTVILLAVFVFSLSVSGTAVIAQDRVTGSLISGADLAFIKSDSISSPSRAFTGGQTLTAEPEAGSLITPADLAFINAYPEGGATQAVRQAVPGDQGPGSLITAADLTLIREYPNAGVTFGQAFVAEWY